MGQVDWHKVKEIFQVAVALPPEQRASFLDEVCSANDGIRREVCSLLEAETGKVAFLEKPIAEHGFSSERALPPGSRIGPYKIEDELGVGGMGRVYRAVRADGLFERVVAIKVLKRDLDSEELIARFRKERQILANFNHPNIARLYEGGVTEGWPYFVMECVTGMPIDRYCSERGLTVRQRLSLFRDVCDAVHYAHRHLVIHRDLKPANILVTDIGVPKLLDFGIAKLLDPESFKPLTLTVLGNRPMTPEYASPEQVGGKQVTTSSDVYALGILLYELLTGSRPYSLTGRTPEEIQRLVAEVLPVKPSLAITENGPISARTKRPDAQKLKNELAGDLDNIVLMALRKEPERRYQSAEQLSGDIGRFLRGFPVLARKETLAYLAGKMFRRHKIAFASAGLALLLLVGFTGVVLFQHQKMRFERERATRISEFLKGIFRGTSPFDTGGQTATALGMLDQAVERVGHDFRNEPDIQAELYVTIGGAYEELDREERALPLFEKALALIRANLRSDRFKEADCLAVLSNNLFMLGRFDEAGQKIQEALGIMETTETDPLRIADLLGLLAQVRRKQGELEDAGNLFKRADDIYRRHQYEHPLFLNQYAGFLVEMEDLASAESLFRRTLTLQKERGDIANLGETHNDLGLLYRKQGKFPEAEEQYRISLDLIRPVLGDRHPRVSTVLGNMASLYVYQKRYPEAETVLVDLLDVMEETDPDRFNTINTLAETYRRQALYEKAEPLYQKALDLADKQQGTAPVFKVAIHHNLGLMYRDQGKYELAEKQLRASLAAIPNKKASPHRIKVLGSLGGLYLLMKNHERAETVLEDAVVSGQRVLGDGHAMLAGIFYDLARLHFETRNMTKAESYCREALSIRQKILGTEDILLLETETFLTKILNAAGNPSGLKHIARNRKGRNR